MLDYVVIRANPKPFIGYSDITAMHLAILVKAGLVTFHGSNASSAFEPENIDVVPGDVDQRRIEDFIFARRFAWWQRSKPSCPVACRASFSAAT